MKTLLILALAITTTAAARPALPGSEYRGVTFDHLVAAHIAAYESAGFTLLRRTSDGEAFVHLRFAYEFEVELTQGNASFYIRSKEGRCVPCVRSAYEFFDVGIEPESSEWLQRTAELAMAGRKAEQELAADLVLTP